MVDRPTEVPLTVALALEFLNTHVRHPGGTVEFIDTGEGLVSWMLLAKLVDGPAAERLLDETASLTLDEIAAEARDLREWFRQFIMRREGHWSATEVLAESRRLNALLSGADTFTTVVAGADDGAAPFRLRSLRRLRSARGMLALIAELLARYLCEGYMISVKPCVERGCGLMFIDSSDARGQMRCRGTCGTTRAWQDARRQAGRGSMSSSGS
jgi:predicted RNA-binding Zn ribbon-like protein